VRGVGERKGGCKEMGERRRERREDREWERRGGGIKIRSRIM